MRKFTWPLDGDRIVRPQEHKVGESRVPGCIKLRFLNALTDGYVWPTSGLRKELKRILISYTSHPQGSGLRLGLQLLDTSYTYYSNCQQSQRIFKKLHFCPLFNFAAQLFVPLSSFVLSRCYWLLDRLAWLTETRSNCRQGRPRSLKGISQILKKFGGLIYC